MAGTLVQGTHVEAGLYRVAVAAEAGPLADGAVAAACFEIVAPAPGTAALCHAAGTPAATGTDGQVQAIRGTCGELRAVAPRQAGDCNGDGTVEITELQQVVNNRFGLAVTGCGECDGSGAVTAAEVELAADCQLGRAGCMTSCQR